MKAKLFLLALASAVLLSACGGSSYRDGGESTATFSDATPQSRHYSTEYSESYNTSRSSPSFAGYPVNERVTVRTG